MLMISSPAVNEIFCAVPIGMIPFRSSFIDFFALKVNRLWCLSLFNYTTVYCKMQQQSPICDYPKKSSFEKKKLTGKPLRIYW